MSGRRASDAAGAGRLYDRRAGVYDAMIRAIGHRRRLRRFVEASGALRPGIAVLDAGCGSGATTMAVHDAAARLGIEGVRYRGFDLSGRMLARAEEWGREVGADVSFVQSDALSLPEGIPRDWRGFGLVVSAGMLEYLPKDRLAPVLAALRGLMADGAMIQVFISRDTVFNRLFIGGFWKANVYGEDELSAAFASAGFRDVRIAPFARWGHAVTALK